MAHFSVSGDSVASVFIFVRIGFEPCINDTLSCNFCIAGPGYLLLLQDVVLLIMIICLLILSLTLQLL